MQPSAPFFLAVEGKGAPKRPHETLDAARVEANRLHSLRGKRVFILATVDTIEPEVLPEVGHGGRPILKLNRAA